MTLTDFEQAKSEADIHVMLVDHAPFKTSAPASDYIVDVKGLWKP